MAVVRFAQLCDHCGKRSREYGGWFTCRECLEDICDTCAAPGTTDDETARCVCKRCQTAAGDYAPVLDGSVTAVASAISS